MRTVCVLPSQSFASQMPALPKGEPRSRCEFFASYAQSKLVSPSGRDVAQRQRGLESAGMAFQICPDSNLSACCPLSHLLRKCQLSQRESREAGANFLPYAQTKLVSPSGRDVAQRQRGLESADMAFQICPDTSFFVLRAKQKQSILRYSVSWWEVVDSLFCGKATPVATCIQHVAKSRLSNPLLLF